MHKPAIAAAHMRVLAQAKTDHAANAQLGRGCVHMLRARRRNNRRDACFGWGARPRRARGAGDAHPTRAPPLSSGEGGARAARALRKRIFGTKAEPQRIVATRPLCRVQHPVPHSSRLQGIHRVGPVTCDRVRLRPKLGVLAAERPTR